MLLHRSRAVYRATALLPTIPGDTQGCSLSRAAGGARIRAYAGMSNNGALLLCR
jgi:hypothetical protein